MPGALYITKNRACMFDVGASAPGLGSRSIAEKFKHTRKKHRCVLREIAPAGLAAAGAVQVPMQPPREPAVSARRRQDYAARQKAQNRAAARRVPALGNGEPGHHYPATRGSVAIGAVARNWRGSTGCLPRRSSK
jgi:hypothetical protein